MACRSWQHINYTVALQICVPFSVILKPRTGTLPAQTYLATVTPLHDQRKQREGWNHPQAGLVTHAWKSSAAEAETERS